MTDLRVVARPASTVRLAVSTLALATAVPTLAQSTAPSSITPPMLRPPPVAADAPPVLPAPDSLTPPAGAAGLTVRVGAVAVIGGFPAVAGETRAITDRLVGRTVTLAQIYAAAAQIEATHIRHGYLLARAVVPPQQIEAGGTITIRIIDGFVERIDLAGLPARVRAPVRRRVVALEGQRHPTLAAIERPLTLAGEVPGLALASTLARGEAEGATRLLLAGRYTPVRGSLTIDNSLADSLGRGAVTAQLSLNSVLGLGEQFYGFAVSGYDVARALRADAPVRVLGGGATIGLGDGRLSLNPELTFSRTQPLPQADVPRIRGTLARFTLRGGYVLAKSRRGSLVAGLTIEHIREANDALDFDTAISLDRFIAARAQLSYAATMSGGGGVSLLAQVSKGLGGGVSADAPVSREGADASFVRANLNARVLKPLTARLSVSVTAHAQTSFGQPLFRSEQATLEGPDALSAYIGGITAVDSNATLRVEVARGPLTLGPVRLSPYVFGAAGIGWISRPTAVEQVRYTLYDPGMGIRGALAGGHVSATLEYGHGFSAIPRFDHVDRLSAALTLAI